MKLVSIDTGDACPVRQFVIPARSKFTVKDVSAGEYDVRYRDLTDGTLARSEAFVLNEIRDTDGTRFSNITMTLYKVSNGNMQTYPLAEAEF